MVVIIETTNILLIINLLLLSYIDYKLLCIPNCLIYLIYILRLVASVDITTDNIASMILFSAPFYFFEAKRKSIGMGDVLLIKALCFYLGFEKSLVGLYYTGIASGCMLVLLLIQYGNRTRKYPFVPIISIGFMLAL